MNVYMNVHTCVHCTLKGYPNEEPIVICNNKNDLFSNNTYIIIL